MLFKVGIVRKNARGRSPRPTPECITVYTGVRSTGQAATQESGYPQQASCKGQGRYP